ncbi:MAG: TIGR00645 family protein [Bauldia sp.]
MANNKIERGLEGAVFNSRWLMAPFYIGLIVSLIALLVKFVLILVEFVSHAWGASESDIVLGVLGLVDFTLTGNLIVIIIFSGYENFVSRIEATDHPDWPEWMAKIDFTGLKQKLLASIVAISAIQVLKAFMNLESDVHTDTTKLGWLVGIHLVFVASTLLLAWADKLSDGHH